MELNCCGNNQEDERVRRTLEFINENKGIKGALIPVLHGIQDSFGYLPEEALRKVSEELEIPMNEIYGTASFYSYFSLEPKGEHIIRVCLGTACYVKGGQSLIEELSRELNIQAGETTEDGRFTLESTRCLGACGLAPVMMIDNKVYGRLTPNKIKEILSEYR